MLALAATGEEFDDGRRQELDHDLMHNFVKSPEATTLNDIQFYHNVVDFAAGFFGEDRHARPASARRDRLRYHPAEGQHRGSQARWIIEENRARYLFLKRECDLPQADACLRVLGGDSVERLEAARSDASNFGMAKSLFDEGRAGGFDMESKEGLAAWIAAMKSKPWSPSQPLRARSRSNERRL